MASWNHVVLWYGETAFSRVFLLQACPAPRRMRRMQRPHTHTHTRAHTGMAFMWACPGELDEGHARTLPSSKPRTATTQTFGRPRPCKVLRRRLLLGGPHRAQAGEPRGQHTVSTRSAHGQRTVSARSARGQRTVSTRSAQGRHTAGIRHETADSRQQTADSTRHTAHGTRHTANSTRHPAPGTRHPAPRTQHTPCAEGIPVQFPGSLLGCAGFAILTAPGDRACVDAHETTK